MFLREVAPAAGFCPSCGARRMSQTAVHLIDHALALPPGRSPGTNSPPDCLCPGSLPHVPVRQRVRVRQLRLPIPLRVLLAAQPELVALVLQVVQRVASRQLLQAAGRSTDEGRGGAVTPIQRFGSAASLNIHLHRLLLDGVCRCGAEGVSEFVEARSPTADEVHALLQAIITRLMKLLTRASVLVEDMGQTYLAESDADGEEARTLRPLQAAAITYRIGFGPRAGQKVLALRGATPQRGSRCAPTSTASVCMPRCVSRHTSASGWSSGTATSPGRRCPTSGCSSTPQGRWSSSSRRRGATQRRTWS